MYCRGAGGSTYAILGLRACRLIQTFDTIFCSTRCISRMTLPKVIMAPRSFTYLLQNTVLSEFTSYRATEIRSQLKRLYSDELRATEFTERIFIIHSKSIGFVALLERERFLKSDAFARNFTTASKQFAFGPTDPFDWSVYHSKVRLGLCYVDLSVSSKYQ